MISAIPALSSAPSRVVPSLVTMSWPTRAASAGSAFGSSVCRGSPGRTIVSPSHDSWTIGVTPAPVTSGVVSTWAMSPTTGASALPGSVAKTEWPSFSSASERPISWSSARSMRERSSCFTVLGRSATRYAACVSTRTYRRNRWRTSSASSSASGLENGALGAKLPEPDEDLAHRLDAELDGVFGDVLVRRMHVALALDAESCGDGRQPTSDEARVDRQRAAGAHEKRSRTDDLLEGIAGEPDRIGAHGRERRTRAVLDGDLELCPV